MHPIWATPVPTFPVSTPRGSFMLYCNHENDVTYIIVGLVALFHYPTTK